MIDARGRFYLLDYEYANFNSIFYDYSNLLGEIQFQHTKESPYFEFKPQNIHLGNLHSRIVKHLQLKT